MVEHTSVTSLITEYREPRADGRPGRLIAACLADRQADGLSMIYSFYDPEIADRQGLGNFVILDHIRRAAAARLPFVYLGYWVEGSERMQYKVRYRPLEVLGPGGWRRLGDEEHARLIQRIDGAGRPAPAPEGACKDGAADMQKQFV